MCWSISPCNRISGAKAIALQHQPSILHVLEHRPLHQDFKRKTLPGYASSCQRMSITARMMHRMPPKPRALVVELPLARPPVAESLPVTTMNLRPARAL